MSIQLISSEITSQRSTDHLASPFRFLCGVYVFSVTIMVSLNFKGDDTTFKACQWHDLVTIHENIKNVGLVKTTKFPTDKM